jgi:gas vesicle protein
MKGKERKQWKNMNSEEKRNYWIKWDNRDKTGVNLERKKINNIRKTQGTKYVDEITNFIKDFLEIILYQYNEYRNDFNSNTDKVKRDIKNTFDKYTSLIIVLILLYFLKDFLMWLLVKFDKLLKD